MNIEQPKVIGRIIKVSKSGWGFISSKDIEFTRIFFHWTALRQDTLGFPELRTGMMVEFFPLRVPDKGWRAVQVRVVDVDKPGKEVKTNESTDSSMSPLHELGPDNDGVDAA